MILLDQNTKEIADKILDMTKAGVIEVYSKIQQAAPELWRLVIRQKAIDGVECLVLAALMLPVLAFGIWMLKKAFDDDGDEGHLVTGVICSLLGGILLPTFLINGLDLALNPSYWALKDILEMVRGH